MAIVQVAEVNWWPGFFIFSSEKEGEKLLFTSQTDYSRQEKEVENGQIPLKE